MKLAALSALGLAIVASSAQAEGNLEGTYSGAFNLQTQSRGVIAIPMSVTITSAKDGKLVGKAMRSHNNKAGQGCMGEYQLQGVYEGNKVEMMSKPGGPAGDCTMHLRLVAEGNKLKGTMGNAPVELSK